jgi:hypothetical protein
VVNPIAAATDKKCGRLRPSVADERAYRDPVATRIRVNSFDPTRLAWDPGSFKVELGRLAGLVAGTCLWIGVVACLHEVWQVSLTFDGLRPGSLPKALNRLREHAERV